MTSRREEKSRRAEEAGLGCTFWESKISTVREALKTSHALSPPSNSYIVNRLMTIMELFWKVAVVLELEVVSQSLASFRRSVWKHGDSMQAGYRQVGKCS